MNKRKEPLYILVIGLVLILPLFFIGTFHIECGASFIGAIEIIISVLICIFVAFIATECDRRAGYFKCKKCYRKFTPGIKKYTLAFHTPRKRRMKCPHCGKKSWCEHIIE